MPPKKPPSPVPPPVEEEAEEEEPKQYELLQGDFIFPDGTIYKGQYTKLDDGDVIIHGEGLLQSGPESFKGVFELGMYKSGEYKSCNGAKYVGSFRNNLFHGLGDYSWPDGRAYKGTWKDGDMHGRGHFQNFQISDKEFRGFSLKGKFCSEPTAQQVARRDFMGDYGEEYVTSAREALLKIAARTREEVPVNSLPPLSLEDADTDNAPGARDRFEACKALRDWIESLVKPPYCTQGDIPVEALKAFAASLAQGADNPAEASCVEAKNEAACIGPGRILHEQLQHVGQVIEFALPESEAPNLVAVSLLNISKEYDVDKASWRIILVKEAPPPIPRSP